MSKRTGRPTCALGIGQLVLLFGLGALVSGLLFTSLVTAEFFLSKGPQRPPTTSTDPGGHPPAAPPPSSHQPFDDEACPESDFARHATLFLSLQGWALAFSVVPLALWWTSSVRLLVLPSRWVKVQGVVAVVALVILVQTALLPRHPMDSAIANVARLLISAAFFGSALLALLIGLLLTGWNPTSSERAAGKPDRIVDSSQRSNSSSVDQRSASLSPEGSMSPGRRTGRCDERCPTALSASNFGRDRSDSTQSTSQRLSPRSPSVRRAVDSSPRTPRTDDPLDQSHWQRVRSTIHLGEQSFSGSI